MRSMTLSWAALRGLVPINAHVTAKGPADAIPAGPAIPSQPIFPVNH
jgi:hypothetical protein